MRLSIGSHLQKRRKYIHVGSVGDVLSPTVLQMTPDTKQKVGQIVRACSTALPM